MAFELVENSIGAPSATWYNRVTNGVFRLGEYVKDTVGQIT